VRKLLAALGALACAVGASACSTNSTAAGVSVPSTTASGSHGSTTTVPSSPGANGASAARAMNGALENGAAQTSLHYVSTSTVEGTTTTIVGDVNRTSGSQTIVVTYKKQKATIAIELVGHEAYFRGDATAIEVLVGLTAPVSALAAGRWVSVVPADHVYNSTAAALTVGSVLSEITLKPPLTGGRRAVVGNRTLAEIAGAWVGDGVTAKEHATALLEVTGGASSLPVRFSGVTPGSAAAPRFVESIVLSRWGEPVKVAPPSSSTPLSVIAGEAAPTTTQPPTVV